jgi:hypothetical protein
MDWNLHGDSGCYSTFQNAVSRFPLVKRSITMGELHEPRKLTCGKPNSVVMKIT